MNTRQQTHKKIFLIGPPRSLSTAFLRMMSERGDFTIINEPACCVFNKHHYPHSQMIYKSDAATNYHEARATIEKAAQNNPIFIKEMSFAFEEFIDAEPDLLSDPNNYFVFLVRDPHPGIISYYKKIAPQALDYIVADLEQLTGYQALYNSFKTVQNKAFNQPGIIHAEQLYTNAPHTVRAFCEYVNIPFQQEHLHWNSLDKEFSGTKEWNENKKQEFTQHWHRDALLSTGFHQPAKYQLDEHRKPSFAEIDNATHREICIKTYQNSKPFYDKFKSVDLNI